jgi:hypothetical protein
MAGQVGKLSVVPDKSAEDKEDNPRFPLDPSQLDDLCSRFQAEAKDNESLRTAYENSWVKDLRQSKGFYEPHDLKLINANHSVHSTTYYKYTSSKESPMVAKLCNMLFPSGGQNWDVKPEESPEVAPEDMAAIMATLADPEDIGAMASALSVWSKDRSAKMKKILATRMDEMKYVQKGRRVVKSAVGFGTGIIRGPLTVSRIKRKLTKENGSYKMSAEKAFSPGMDDVSIWYFFPDLSTSDFDQCEYVYLLHPKTRHEMRELKKQKGFFGDKITDLLESVPDGNYQIRQWEERLSSIQEGRGEDKTTDAPKKYEVWERDGWVDGQKLAKAGLIDKDDADKEWFVNVWFCGGKCIRASAWADPIEKLTDLYHLFYYKKDDTSVFGTGLPYDLRDLATAISSTVRLMQNNAVKSSEAIWEIFQDLLATKNRELPGLQPGEIVPREGGFDSVSAQIPLMRKYETPNFTSAYLSLLNKMEEMGDAVSGIFRSMYAPQSSDETKKAFAGRGQNVNEVIMDFTRNFDEANESFISKLYSWEMIYGEDENSKGDLTIMAVGSTSLLARELQLEGMKQFRANLRPEEMVYLDVREILLEELRLMDLHNNITVKSEAEAEKGRERQRQEQAKALELAQAEQQANISYTQGKDMHMRAKANAVPALAAIKEHQESVKNVKARDGLVQSEHDRNMDKAKLEHQANMETAGKIIDIHSALTDQNSKETENQ